MHIKPKASLGNDDLFKTRTISVSRTSVRKDILTALDSHQGIMDKQSPSFHKLWQKRYFVLARRVLKYYKKKDDHDKGNQPKGVINF